MEACGNFRRPAAREKIGVPGPSVCEVEALRKNPFGPVTSCSMEVEAEDMSLRSIRRLFFKLLQRTRKRNYRLNYTI